MAESNFSWKKLASFIGALVFAVVCIMMIGFGTSLITNGETTYGIVCIVAGVISGFVTYITYKNYQKSKE